jgi:hypothetical protein
MLNIDGLSIKLQNFRATVYKHPLFCNWNIIIYMFSMDFCDIQNAVILGLDEIENGDTHDRVNLIDSTPFCLENLSSKV